MNEEIFKKYKIKAKKSLGQNFLVDENILREISETLDIEGKNIVEVGPGYGALTERLLEGKPKRLELVELDNDMINILEDRIEIGELDIQNIQFNIQNIDILKYIPEFEKYSVIANIPYYITSPILRHFLYGVERLPEEMLILMQKDVGVKILKTPINPPLSRGRKLKSSVLGLFIAKKCRVKEVLLVPKESFVPAPTVESSVLLFEIHNLYNEINDENFMKLIKIGFSSARKKLIKNLVSGGYDKQHVLKVFTELEINEKSRGEELSIEKWCELVEKI